MGSQVRKKFIMKRLLWVKLRFNNQYPIIKRKLSSSYPLLSQSKLNRIPSMQISLQGKHYNIYRWTPKNDQPVPVPLLFEHKRLDCMISRIAANNQTNSKIRLVYLGSRF